MKKILLLIVMFFGLYGIANSETFVPGYYTYAFGSGMYVYDHDLVTPPGAQLIYIYDPNMMISCNVYIWDDNNMPVGTTTGLIHINDVEKRNPDIVLPTVSPWELHVGYFITWEVPDFMGTYYSGTSLITNVGGQSILYGN